MRKIVGLWPHNKTLKDQIEAEFPEALVVPAQPGGPGPVLAVREMPPFAADVILVMDRGSLDTAIALITGTGVKFVPMRDTLAKMLGGKPGDVKEIAS